MSNAAFRGKDTRTIMQPHAHEKEELAISAPERGEAWHGT